LHKINKYWKSQLLIHQKKIENNSLKYLNVNANIIKLKRVLLISTFFSPGAQYYRKLFRVYIVSDSS